MGEKFRLENYGENSIDLNEWAVTTLLTSLNQLQWSHDKLTPGERVIINNIELF